MVIHNMIVYQMVIGNPLLITADPIADACATSAQLLTDNDRAMLVIYFERLAILSTRLSSK